MTPPNSVSRFILAILISLLLRIPSSAATAQDYGDLELSAPERYDEALKLLYGINGRGKNRTAAIAHLKKATESGYGPAYNLLAALYLEGNGFFASPRKALRLFEEGAATGDPISQYNAAYSYLIGRGARSDLDKAERYLLQVVDEKQRGSVSPEQFGEIRRARGTAYLMLGLLYGDEDDANRYSLAKSSQYLEEANKLGNPMSAMLLAIRYAEGEGVTQDQAKSKELLERYKVASVNVVSNSLGQVLFQGMDQEEIQKNMQSVIGAYEDEMSKRVASMQIAFGVSLLDDMKLYSPEQAFAWLEPVATKDHPQACARVARLYYLGQGVAEDKAKARSYLEMSYKMIPMAAYNLAVMLEKGEGGEADPDRARRLMESANQDGWYPAYCVVERKEEGKFITTYDALKLEERRAELEESQALFCLGRRYIFGIGVDQDIMRGRNLLDRARTQGNVQADYFYGVYLAKDTNFWGGATEEDKIIEVAANSGYAPAMLRLGKKLRDQGKDKEAFERTKKAAEIGYAPAMSELGVYYRDGVSVNRNYGAALENYAAAIEREDPFGYVWLGQANELGEGVDENPEEAYRLYLEGAERGAVIGNYAVGNILGSGKLGREAWDEAIPYLEKAADHYMRIALLQLGDCYREGLGVERNVGLALRQYQIALQVGGYNDKDTTYRMALVKFIEDGPDYHPKQGLASLRMLEMGGNYPLAAYQLGILNMEGVGMKPNPAKAVEKFRTMATVMGNELRETLSGDFARYFPDAKQRYRPERWWGLRPQNERLAAIDSCYRYGQIVRSGKLKEFAAADCVPLIAFAAENECHQAQFDLSQMYAKGEYVEADFGKSLEWAVKSATAVPAAQVMVGRAFFEGKFDGIDETRAISLLRSAARSGSEEAATLLKSRGISLEDLDAEGELPNALPEKKGSDDGIDGPIDLDLA